MGISELVIILVIVLIIFGAGRLPQIGEGVGKALRGFKKEIHEAPPPEEQNVQAAPATNPPQASQASPSEPAQAAAPVPGAPQPTAPYTPGPELTPGTTAALMAQAGPQPPKPPKPKVGAQPQPGNATASTTPGSQTSGIPTMEERVANPAPAPRASYPPVPAAARPQPAAKRPSAVVNKDAVARVQAQQAAMRAKPAPSGQASGLTPDDMQSFGAGLGDALRTIRSAVSDVRNTIEPEVRTLRAEVDAAQKEVEQSVELAKDLPSVQEEPPPKKS